MSVYNNSSIHTDSFVWESGDVDLEHGKPGSAFRLNEPGPGGWTFDVFQELAITLLPPDPCPADFDGDGNVGVSDLLTLLANWGPCP